MSLLKAYIRTLLSLIKGPWISYDFTYIPFNYTKPLPPSANQVMKILTRGLRDIGENFRLTDGTVLGLYREGRFIPHDNDIDVDILDPKSVHHIQQLMSDHGFKLGRKVVYAGKVQQLVYFNDDEVLFDMVVWYTDGASIVNHSEPGYVRTQEKKYFLNLEQLQFDGETYPVPGIVEDWLKMRYGDDWRTPKTYKGDWKEECKDISKKK